MTITLTLGQAIRWGLTIIGLYLAFKPRRASSDWDFVTPMIGVLFLAFVVVGWVGYWLGRIG